MTLSLARMALGLLVWSPATRFPLTSIRLHCVGEMIQAQAAGSERRPWSNDFTIDLEGRRWCEAGCSASHPIVSVGADVLKLIEEQKDRFATASHLNRKTGRFTFLSKGVVDGVRVETGVQAQCSRAADTKAGPL